MREIIHTENAPKAIGPYSQAVKISCGTMIFCAGQTPLDPKTMVLVGETAAEQCKQVMANIQAVLKAAGADFSNVVKTTIFLKDMNDFASVNEVYGGYFSAPPPARSTVEVSRLPKDCRVEIEVIAMA
ncbi:MAG: RidA family protein [candidate division Zixibacteria bacterium]|nr:RidA family protein [candidate division Zixibacteria bacterium]